MLIEKEVQRLYFIGDEWIYYKIYCGVKTTDSILTSVIKPIMNSLIERKIINKWFFIRYGDPDFHLRLRINYNHPEGIYVVSNEVNKGLSYFLGNNFIWKIQTDTYQRELERYGLNTINFSEQLFYHDSKMVCDFINVIEMNLLNTTIIEGENLRWLFALRAIDSFLNTFQMKDEDKKLFLEPIRDAFFQEFGLIGKYKRSLDKKYRIERSRIEDFLCQKNDPPPILEIITIKEESIKEIAHEILKYRDKGLLMVNFNNLIGSHIHMMLNRLFRSKNRLHETICYDFLFRYYKSKIARKKRTI